jgi:hypothetical protein
MNETTDPQHFARRSFRPTARKALAYAVGAVLATVALSAVVKKVSDSDPTE